MERSLQRIIFTLLAQFLLFSSAFAQVNAPENLQATPQQNSSILLTWTSPDIVETFQIERSENGNDGWTEIAQVGGDVTSYTNTGLQPNTRYYYRVYATWITNSPNSNVADATTFSLPDVPSELVATAASSSLINLSWKDNSNNEDNFILEWSPNGTSGWTAITLAADTKTYSHTTLTASTIYYYRVKARNTEGESAYSAVVNATTLPTIPTAPSGFTAIAFSSTQINLSWNDNPNETEYIIERSTTAGGPYAEIHRTAANVTTFANTGLNGNTTYYYVIKAGNTSGISPASGQVSATTPTVVTAPTTPTGLAATASSTTQINLTWNDTPNETEYIIERSTTSGGPYSEAARPAANATSYPNTGLTPNTTYYYVIKAANSAGTSAPSAQVSATTPAVVTIPTAPTGLSADIITSSGFTAKWSPVTGATTYFIDVSEDNFATFVAGYNNKSITNPSEVITSLKSNTDYKFRVRASNSAGTSSNSAEYPVKTLVFIPSAPTGLSASNITSTGFTANWEAAEGATSYELDVSTDNFSTFIAGYNGKSITATSEAISSLQPNTTYRFRVRGVNSGGESSNSAVFTVKTPTNAPAAPVANNVTIYNQTEFVGSWSMVAGANGYRLDVSTDNFSTFVTGYEAREVLGTTISVTNLTPNTAYKFRVRAINDGGVSANSNVVSVTTLPSIPAPPVTIPAEETTSNSFIARWNASDGATSYELEVSDDNFSSYVTGFNPRTVSTTNVSVTGLSSNKTYQYRVRAKNSGGTSGYSNITTVKTLHPVPSAPVATSATSIGKNSFTAHWKKVNNASNYKFDLSTNNFSTYVTGYENISVADTFFTVTGLNVETNYQYRVRAENNGGTSPSSNVIAVKTLPNVPGQPTAFVATNVNSSSFTANWEAVPLSTGYQLDVSADNFSTFVAGYNSKSVSGTSAIVTGLSPKTAYKYRIRSINAGGASPNSNVIDVTTLPNTPTAPIAYNPVTVTQTGFKAIWSKVPGATVYIFDLSNDNFATNLPGYSAVHVTDTSIVVSNLVANSSYKYRVRASNSAGTSPNSNVISVTTLPNPPPAPVAIAASNIKKTSFTARWETVPGITKYLLDVSTDNFNTFLANYQNKEVTGSSIEITNLLVNTTYQYRVRAVNNAGTSANSNTINTTTLPNVQGSPYVSNATTKEDIQTLPELLVKPSEPIDPNIKYFKIIKITGGTLYKFDGITVIPEGSFIDLGDGARGLRFTPALNSTDNGSFDAIASSTPSDEGLEGEAATAIITVIPVNDLPVLSNPGEESMLYSQGDGNKIITNTILVEDVDTYELDSAVIQFTEGYQRGNDFLYFKNTEKIKEKSYDASKGILVLVGKAEQELWESALQNVLFYNNITGATDIGLKEVSYKIWDGENFSEPVTKKIQIKDVFVDIEIPTGITPNNDGVNDTWTLGNVALYPNCVVEIYGKNGERIFNSEGYKKKWDGTYKNQPLASGTYYYFIDLREKGKKYRGTIAIIR